LNLRHREFDDSKLESTLHCYVRPFQRNKWPKEAFFQHPCHFLNNVNSLIHIRSPCSKEKSAMNFSQTLELLRKKEKQSGSLLESALSLKRYRKWSNLPVLQGTDAFYLPAVSAKARIKWGLIFIEKIFNFFNLNDDDDGPIEPVFLVTIAEKSGLTTDQPQHINLQGIKRKLGSGLQGLSYIGMIEPGYYCNIYQSGEKQNNVVSWHGHFLLWGVSRKQLDRHLRKIRPRFTAIMPGRCAVHKKTIQPDQFGYKLCYIIKSPRKEYSIGRRLNSDERTGDARYKQNSRNIRPGHRVKLFHLMRDMYLDQLAMAGGKGRELLQQIKYKALRDYRRKIGWDERRP
jgi:hypothetical protein